MIRIAITGPESTGKSWLAEQLAVHYRTVWVPEYAREFLSKTGGSYDYEDILAISKGQLYSENGLLDNANEVLFCDTEFLVTWIWCEVKYGKVHPFIQEAARNHRYDLYLLCNIDLPWEYDPLREHPDMRHKLFEMYQQKLERLDANFRVISGFGRERLQEAILAVEELIGNRV
jgi:NadR type nicotinamide-nucleotide adenylyltransferase